MTDITLFGVNTIVIMCPVNNNPIDISVIIRFVMACPCPGDMGHVAVETCGH